MNPSIKERCEYLNIDNNILLYGDGMPSCIEIYIDIPDLQYNKDKILLISSVLLPSIKDIIADTYPHLLVDYMNTHDMVQLVFITNPQNEETYIDIIEHIIDIIQTINEDNEDEDIITIDYDRAITYLRIL